jgi:hypothetical protein
VETWFAVVLVGLGGCVLFTLLYVQLIMLPPPPRNPSWRILMARVRKALIAALAAFVTGLTTALVNGDQPDTAEGWVGLVAGCLAAALLAGAATYRVRNAGTVNGSDPYTRQVP